MCIRDSYSNCIKNGVLPIRLSATDCSHIRIELHECPGASLVIDLDEQAVLSPDQIRYTFEIDPLDKTRLINGLDDISMTLEYQAKIESFEQKYRQNNRWIF